MKFLRFLAITMTLLIGMRTAFAQGFADTTDGVLEEKDGGFTKEQFEEMKKAPQGSPQRVFYENLIHGRFSSSQDGRSRFAGHLELHDFDLDGITDHGSADNDAEGATEKAALGKGGMPGGEARESALEKARLKKGSSKTCIANATQTDRGSSECKNLSAAVLDVGSAHPGDDNDAEEHRVYILNPEAQKDLEKAGQSYFADFKAQVLGKDPKTRDYGNDAIRSEAAWLYRQWQFKVETSWKTLRAARLAGFRTDDPNDRQGKEFMRRIGSMLAKNGSNDNIAKEIYLRSEVMDVDFCPSNRKWVVCTPELRTAANNAQTPPLPFRAIWNDGIPRLAAPHIYPSLPGPVEKNVFYTDALNAASANIANDRDAQTKIASIAKCLPAAVWCNTPLNEARDRTAAENESRMTGRPLRTNLIKAYTPAAGDIGNVYSDTREILFIKMDLASKLPLAKQRAFVDGNMDFSAKMSGGRDNPVYASWIKYLTETEKMVDEIHDMGRQQRLEAEASGSKGSDLIERTFDKNNRTVLQMFGNNSVNETYSGGYGNSSAPAPASTIPSKQPLPGVDFGKQ